MLEQDRGRLAGLVACTLSHRLAAVASLGHFTIEVYSGLLPVLYPLLVVALGLSYVQVGGIASAFIIASALPQPLFGYLSDRHGSRWYTSLAVLWMAVLIATATFTRNYAALVLLLTLAGLGSSAFHPAAATDASRPARTTRGGNVSVFLASGNVGYAVGPLVAAPLLAAGPTTTTLFLLLSALAVALIIAWTPRPERRPAGEPVDNRPVQSIGVVAPSRVSLVALGLLMALRAWVHIGFATYLPLFWVEQRLTLLASSRLLALLLLSVAAGTTTGGFLADRLNRRALLSVALLCSVPVNVVLLAMPPVLLVFFAPVAGFLIGLPIPIILLTAHDLLPQRLGVASGIAIGMAFVAGSLGSALTGIIAEHATLRMALLALALLPLLASLCALALPVRRAQPAAVPARS